MQRLPIPWQSTSLSRTTVWTMRESKEENSQHDWETELHSAQLFDTDTTAGRALDGLADLSLLLAKHTVFQKLGLPWMWDAQPGLGTVSCLLS